MTYNIYSEEHSEAVANSPGGDPCEERENVLKVVYIAGKYRDERGEFYVKANIRTAEREALNVWLWGGVALCPHMNTRFFGGAFGIKDSTWLEGDKELLRRCDALYAIAGWESSSGAMAEVEHAKELGLPILYNHADVLRFLGHP